MQSSGSGKGVERHEAFSQADPTLMVPFKRNPRFTGHEALLREIEEKLFAGEQTTEMVITGLGGVGKTQLALELVYRIRTKHKNCLIIWIQATNRESLEQAYLDVAKKLGISGYERDKANAKRLVQSHLSNENAGQWLLVFDDADDIDLWTNKSDNGSDGLIEYLPKSTRGSILITTRDARIATKFKYPNIVDVPPMDKSVAAQLLQKCLVDHNTVESADVTTLLSQLNYLPLAIVQAAAFIRKNQITVEHYLSLLASTHLLQGQWKEAEELRLQVMETRKRALGAEHPDTLTSMANLALTYLHQERWKEAEELGLQVMETRKRVLGAEHPDTLTSMANQASTYLHQGRWKEAKELSLQVMETRKRVLSAEHPDTLTIMANQALPYLLYQGRWKEAEELGLQVIETGKRVLGAEHPDTLTSMANLASTYLHQERWKEAEELGLQVMETRKRVLGAEHSDTLTSMANLASTYLHQERWKEAEELDVHVVETRKRVFGAEHPITIACMANLASTYRNQGRWREAEELEVQVMESRKKMLGAELPVTLTYRNQGGLKELEELDPSDVTSTVHPSTFWSDQADSTNPSSISQVAVDQEQAADGRSPMAFYRYKEPATEYETDNSDDDVKSVDTISDDIDSLAEPPPEKAHYRQAAVNYIVKIFTDDTELEALYQEAASKMDEAKFVRNHRRLLKRFFLDLRSEGHTPSQKLAVRFLRSRSSRTYISSEIHRLVMPSDNTVREKINIMLKQAQGNLSLLDRFLNDEDSAAQLAPTSSTDINPDGEPQTWSRDKYHADSTSEESDDSEPEIEGRGMLFKLEATADFLTSGPPFGLFKDNLRAFLHPVHSAGHLQDGLHNGVQAKGPEQNELSDVVYDVSLARGFNLAIYDIFKRVVERMAGCQLAWWPLSEPEDQLEAGHIRVYSTVRRGRRFYDDIPAALAELLFPKISDVRARAPNPGLEFLRREAVYLHNTTLMRLLLHHFALEASTSTGERALLGTQGRTRPTVAGTPSNSSVSSRKAQAAQWRDGASATSQLDISTSRSGNKLKKRTPGIAETKSGVSSDVHGDDKQDNPVLFLSVDTKLNESIAKAAPLGEDDKGTIQGLHEVYKSISSRWWRLKWVTGIKFYRFHSFLFKNTPSIYYVDVHKDKERYPEKSDQEYGEYRYTPQPWPPGFPYPSREVWYYFMHPEDCGTSRELNGRLPLRVNGCIIPHSRAFGIHLEEKHSILAILIPVFIVFLITLGGAVWFIPPWLKKHPDDLQNATVPMFLAFAVVGFCVQFFVSLFVLRWSNT